MLEAYQCDLLLHDEHLRGVVGTELSMGLMATSPFLVRDRLTQALREFSASQRYQVFKTIQVGRLMPDEIDEDSKLYATTFEELVDLVKRGQLERILSSTALQDAILHLVLALNEDEGEVVQAETKPDDAPETSSDPQEASEDDSTERFQSSVQLELELRRLLGEIRAHPRYESVRRRTIGEFWDARWTPAPFEEALTLSQLTSLDLTVLFKKKMVSDSRIHNLCQALERVVAELSAGKEVPSPAPARGPEPENQAIFDEELATVSEDPSVAALAIYEVLVRGQREQPYSELVSLIDELIMQCSPRECVDVALGKPIHETLKSKVLRIVKQTVSPERLETVSILLQGPAVRVDIIARTISTTSQPATALLRVLATVVAQGLGARPVCHSGIIYHGFWTLNPKILTDYLCSARTGRLRSDISVDPFLLRFLQIQGEPVVRGKGRRNGLNSRARRAK